MKYDTKCITYAQEQTNKAKMANLQKKNKKKMTNIIIQK